MITTIKENQRLMFITHRTEQYTEVDETRMVLEGGCGWIQIRMKQGLQPEVVTNIVALCRNYPDVIVCVDDDVEMALVCGASAVHLGKQDMPLRKARQLVEAHGQENNFWIGATANTFDDICRAYDEGASYIGLGPFRHTDTKSNLSSLLGLESYRNILNKCKAAAIEIPIFAIGGITSVDIKPLLAVGVSGVAASGAILRASDPTEETRHFLHLIHT